MSYVSYDNKNAGIHSTMPSSSSIGYTVPKKQTISQQNK
jgi:hypothetical protein